MKKNEEEISQPKEGNGNKKGKNEMKAEIQNG